MSGARVRAIALRAPSLSPFGLSPSVSALRVSINYRKEGAVSTESHNRIVPEIVKQLIRESDGESDCMVALESVVFGVMLYYRPKPRHAGEMMDSMTAAVIERLRP